ncbi:lipopolysaccharide assembly protein LapA domain-containing protein [Hansschlegelia quercus]|uniref:LapA family protein n=1 Tax=Hansschlegelia quercus TaxID=2528245 RepID=A0A4Q9GH42_9HYPH|nr:LapA family protein [Hansschlegelia quercus]TBN53453.1 LapA family protein [Hansschlegelia quercus]
MTFRRFLSGLIGIPLAIVIVLFAVANRQDVVVGFDPFAPEAPALAVTLPLFAVILASLMAGVVVGGVASWAGQRRWRKEAKRRRAETGRLEAEREAARREAAAARNALALPAPRQAA